MARKTIESLIAAVVALGGIFGLIVDAPDVFALALKGLSASFAWLRQMNSAVGYWLLIVGGIASLAWIHLGDKIRSSLGVRIARRFRPDVGRAFPSKASPSSPNNESEMPATREDVIKLAHAIAESSDFASEIAHLTKETAIAEVRTILLRGVEPKIDGIRRQLDDTRLTLDQSDRDIGILLYYALYDINLRTLRDLLSSAPKLILYYEQEKITAEWLREQQAMADDFVARTTKALRYTPRFDRLLSVLTNAESEADHQVRQMPADRRPNDVDPFDLRTYVIATHKCNKVVAFLTQEEVEMVENTASQREAIQERFSLRNP